MVDQLINAIVKMGFHQYSSMIASFPIDVRKSGNAPTKSWIFYG